MKLPRWNSPNGLQIRAILTTIATAVLLCVGEAIAFYIGRMTNGGCH
jgi:hypothetical protein